MAKILKFGLLPSRIGQKFEYFGPKIANLAIINPILAPKIKIAIFLLFVILSLFANKFNFYSIFMKNENPNKMWTLLLGFYREDEVVGASISVFNSKKGKTPVFDQSYLIPTVRNNVVESFTKKSVQDLLSANILEPFLNFLEGLQTPVMICCHRAFDSMKFLSDLAASKSPEKGLAMVQRLKNLVPLVADFRWFFQDKFSLSEMSWHELTAVLLMKNPQLALAPSEQAQCSKIRKKCKFKSAKKHYLPFQKWQKNPFLHQKKV